MAELTTSHHAHPARRPIVFFARIAIPLVIVAGLLALTHQGARAASPSPSDPNATSKTQAVFNYLFHLRDSTGQNKIAGQFLGFPDDLTTYFATDVQRATGKSLGVVALDYEDGFRDTSYAGTVDYTDANAVAIDQWMHGGLVQLSWHSHNPLDNSTLDHRLTPTQFANLATPGTTEYTLWHQRLFQVATGLLQLQNAGVTVLWRPMHEMEDTWNWWGGQDATAYQHVWQDEYHYFTTTEGLHNLLWVWCPNHTNSSSDSYYPGDAYVDVVGQDAYGFSGGDSYDYQNATYGAKKILAIPEKDGGLDVQGDQNLAYWSDWEDNATGTGSLQFATDWFALKEHNPYAIMSDAHNLSREDLAAAGVSGSGALETSYSDTFENTAVGGYPHNWLGDGFGGVGNWQVAASGTNHVYGPIAVTPHATSTVDVALDTVTAQADVTVSSHQQSGGVWLATRWNDTGMNILSGYNYATGAWEVRENIGAPNQSLLRAAATGTLADNTTTTLKVVAQGTQVHLYVNNTLTVTATCKKYWAGEVALVADNESATFDNVSITGSHAITTDLALERPVTASSSVTDGQFDTQLLTDGSETSLDHPFLSKGNPDAFKSGTAQTSANHTEWVQVDLGSDMTFDSVTLFPRTDLRNAAGTGSANFPVAFTIQVAPSGGSFTTAKTVSNQPNPNGSAQTYALGTQTARYIKINATTLGDPAADETSTYRLALAELEVFRTTAGPTVLDDTDSSITYTNMTSYSNLGSAYYDGTAHASNQADASFSYQCANCTEILWQATRNSDQGIADVYVDGTKVATVDNYVAGGTRQASSVVFGTGVLTAGQHTLKVVVTGTHNANATDAWIEDDAIQVLTSAPSVLDDTDSSITYTNMMGYSNLGSAYYDGTAHATNQANASFSYQCANCTEILWQATRHSDQGIADVYVDGTKVATVNDYVGGGTRQASSVVFGTGVLTAGQHTLKVVVTGTHDANATDSWIECDAIQRL